MQIIAHLTSGIDRAIDVPDDELTGDLDHDLEQIFYWGQNEFQPRNCPSLSVGDVVKYLDKRWKCEGTGWSADCMTKRV